MNKVEEYIGMMLSSCVDLPTPKINIKVVNYDGSLSFQFNNRMSLNEAKAADMGIPKIVVSAFRDRANVRYSKYDKKYKVEVDKREINNHIYYDIQEKASKWISTRGGHANNRLTKLYKWYREYINPNNFHKDSQLAQDVFNIVEFAYSSSGEEHDKTARVLFQLIKDRYEPKLGSI